MELSCAIIRRAPARKVHYASRPLPCAPISLSPLPPPSPLLQHQADEPYGITLSRSPSAAGYLGPSGWLPRPSCPCSGHESIHGFGAYCKGWEFPGQTPWCYTSDNCTEASGTGGPGDSRFVDCVRDVPPPPPGEPPPAPAPAPTPEPPHPPPPPWRLNTDGWGTPIDCPCSGYSSKLGFGAHCRGWEFEGQTPWCYVNASCGAVPSGTFGEKFMECSRDPGAAPSTGRRLEGAAKGHARSDAATKPAKKENTRKEPTPLSIKVEQATGKKSGHDKTTHKMLEKARASGGNVVVPRKVAGRSAVQVRGVGQERGWGTCGEGRGG